MLVERSDLLIKTGSEAGFEEAMTARGIPLLEGIPGVIWAKLGRGVERPSAFMMLVAWESMDHHTAYNAMPQSLDLRQIIGGFAEGGSMEHFEVPD